MKSCPTCRRTYTDESLLYCLYDGSALVLPYDPEATQRIPSPRVTNQQPTEVLSYDRSYSQPSKPGGNRWLVYTAIALLSVIIGGGVVAFLLRSKEKSSGPQDLSASPSPQTSTNSNQHGVPKAGDAPSDGDVTPSRRLVGAWRAKVSELGDQYEVTFTAHTDGTYQYSAKNAQGQTTAEDSGLWQYSEGILYQRFSNGASGKGSVEWIDDDTFELTILDNGVPAYSGLKRRYHRVR
jgi:hypothetical protein